MDMRGQSVKCTIPEKLDNRSKVTQSKNNNQGIAKVQILEEPLSDEVSPGVTRTVSAQLSPKSLEQQTSSVEGKTANVGNTTDILSPDPEQ